LDAADSYIPSCAARLLIQFVSKRAPRADYGYYSAGHSGMTAHDVSFIACLRVLANL
jgi:hypothetical protein